MSLTVLMNAGPWLPVPPGGYGGIENIVGWLVPELRRRHGVEVILATVGQSTLEVDERLSVFDEGQFRWLAAPYRDAMGVAHAHMQRVIARLRERPVDLVHDHLEVVGPSMLSALGDACPPTLQTLHWDLAKHPEFYGAFDGRGRIFFNAVSNAHQGTAPDNLRRQMVEAVHLAVDVGAYRLEPDKDDYYLTMFRFTKVKGIEIAARVCQKLGVTLRMAGPVADIPNPERLAQELADPQSPYHARLDVQYYRSSVQPLEDGDKITWVGTVYGPEKQGLLGRAKALLAPIQWEEPGGTAMIEALACGTPVIGMRRGALKDIIEHGETGFLCDNEEELAEYIPRAGEIDPGACRRSAEKRFSVPAMADAYMQRYEVVRRAAGPGPVAQGQPGSSAAAVADRSPPAGSV
jgi:glycosyltransferase involved in cell wall biosynthesis